MSERGHLPGDRFIPWYFAAGMAAVIVANSALIFFATRSWSGLASSRAYERGIAYNRALEEAARQDALGWTLVGTIAKEADGFRLVVRATDREARSLGGLRIAATLERPLGGETPLRIDLAPVGESYAATLPNLKEGQWQLRLVAGRGADLRNTVQRLIVP